MLKSEGMVAAQIGGDAGISGAGSFDIRRKNLLIASLLLVLVTLALYNPVGRDPYLNWDDNAYVYENAHVRAGLTWEEVVWAFTTKAEFNWHPLTWISHALDVTLFGLNPAGPHYVNVLLHAANAVLLFLLLDAATGFAWRSLAVAALFAVHPLNVESVAWIAERKNVLSMLFFLTGLMAYFWYARRPALGRYLAVFLSFALGLMAKPQVITLPCVLLLFDYWPLGRASHRQSGGGSGRNWPQLFLEKIPLFVLAAASAWITMKVQAGAMHFEYPLRVRLENAALSYGEYMLKALWPAGLAPLYPHPGLSVSVTHAALAAAALAVLTIGVFLSRRQYLIVGWLWFVGTLVPMIGLVQVGVQAMADRYAYIALIGLFVMVCWGAGDLSQSLHLPHPVPFLAAGVVLAALMVVTHHQISFWQDNLTLWTHTLNVTEKNYIAEDCVAEALEAQGKLDEAARHSENAVRISPEDPIANLNLGAYQQQKRNYSAAIARYQSVLRFTQNPRLLAAALTDLGYAYYSAGQLEAAQRSFDSALGEQSLNPQAWMGLGLVAAKDGNLALAAADYAKALRLQPTVAGYLLLADALEKAGQKEQAEAARAEAARISHDLNGGVGQAQPLLRP
ncbi:MAG TPA: tetratricopeptide repeat protein [Candidatus Bathyarchaeia archaeon]|nr:tetratricopeptide repeat protein [Candidatus Bathyarchaeia archaeon]